MGVTQSCCSTRTRLQGNTLEKKELLVLCDVLKHAQEQPGQHLDSSCFERIFQDQPILGQQIYEYCTAALEQDPLTLEGCVNILQQVLAAHDLIPIMLDIVLETHHSPAPNIDPQQAYQFLGLLLAIYLQCALRKPAPDPTLVRTLSDSLLRSSPPHRTTDFLARLEATLPHANKLIRSYLNNRLLQKPFNHMRIMTIPHDSFVLKYEHLALLGLAHGDLHKYPQLTLLYQAALADVSYAKLFPNMQTSNTLLLAQFQMDNYRKVTLAVYNQKAWTPDVKLVPMDQTVAFQLHPLFEVIRPNPQLRMTFHQASLMYAVDPKTDQALLYLSQTGSQCLQSTKLLTIELWRCEELQSKLRKSALEDERVSTTSPRQEKKRVSFRLDEQGHSRKSMSVSHQNIFDSQFEKQVEKQVQTPQPLGMKKLGGQKEQALRERVEEEAASPQSPHFKAATEISRELPTFNNPQAKQLNQTMGEGTSSKKLNRPSQQIIEKYQVQRTGRSTSNNQDLRKSVDDILKRYDKKQ